jgi:hypothetical protein
MKHFVRRRKENYKLLCASQFSYLLLVRSRLLFYELEYNFIFLLVPNNCWLLSDRISHRAVVRFSISPTGVERKQWLGTDENWISDRTRNRMEHKTGNKQTPIVHSDRRKKVGISVDFRGWPFNSTPTTRDNRRNAGS